MALYLDSALVTEAQYALDLGWVSGITTNPTLLAKSDLSLVDTLRELVTTFPSEIFYQLTASDLEGMFKEAHKAHAILGEHTVLKIPATLVGFQAVARLSPEMPCAVTAIFSPAQAVVAAEAGARYAICYVNRATRLLGDGLALVGGMAKMLSSTQTEILAASIKSPEEAIATLQAGAHHLTLPLKVLRTLAEHELTEKTVVEFARTGHGFRIE
jgi:transaldolase